MSDIGVRSVKTLINEDQRWVAAGGLSALRDLDTVTLDMSTAGGFDRSTFPNALLPSGILLGKITASGLYGPYGASPSEVQTITITGTGGDYDLTFAAQNTGAVTYLNSAGDTAVIQAALEALSNINPGDVVVTRGTPAGNTTVFTVTFGGQYIGVNVGQITGNDDTLSGGGHGISSATLVQGGGIVSDGREVAVGFLAVTLKWDRNMPVTSAGRMSAALMWHGEVIESFLPAASGIDPAARLDLASKFRFLS